MSSRVIAAAVLVPLLLGLAGCGDDGDDDGEGAQGPRAAEQPASTAASAGPAPSPPDEASPTADGSSPSVAPARGLKVEVQDTLRLRAPERGQDWISIGRGTRTTTASGYVEVGSVMITVAEFPTSSTDYEEVAVVDLANLSAVEKDAGATRRADREVNGKQGWVIAGAGEDLRLYTFGTIHAGAFVTVQFRMPADLPDPEGLVESVLASVEWK